MVEKNLLHWKKALKYCNQRIAIDIKNYFAHLIKWDVLATLKQYKKSTESYILSIPLWTDAITDDEKIITYCSISDNYQELWDMKFAKKYLQLALKLDPWFKKKLKKFDLLTKWLYLYRLNKREKAKDTLLSYISSRDNTTFKIYKTHTYELLTKIYKKLWNEQEAKKYEKQYKKLSEEK
jgi:tetratricopeptide (TPR) repeat protein